MSHTWEAIRKQRVDLPTLYRYMQEDDEIIYLALCNQLQSYQLLLGEEKDITEENRLMAEYIISRTEQLIEIYAQKIGSDTFIQRPQWDNLTPP